MLPAAIDALTGVTAIETNAAGVTVSATPTDVTELCVAVMVVAPVAMPVAIPDALIVAVGVFDEFHVTVEVMFCVVWLLKVPVAT